MVRERRRQGRDQAPLHRDRLLTLPLHELDLSGVHHFEVAELYGDADSSLMRAVLEGMGLSRK